ncbi:ABC transporter ATP-binding protein [Kiloniella laminariae]|uniref:ABC transporter ATP-binding protein n=2 Tax=Bacteria TaxID=2 RepID=A0ABT4LQ63_9PROT|nr:ABC transporter ATP-binding protein [Kiloniella laminariae]MCZ4283035.1 ABC transporter ATP-binding protein [Kiloniella laminariae]
MAEPILSVSGLCTEVVSDERVARIVRDVSFDLYPGEILGVVGESGCGKSMMGFALLNLLDPPARVASGSVSYAGQDITKLPHEDLRGIRGNRIAMIFQDPMVSLNPVLTIGEQMMEAVLAHQNVSREEAKARTVEVLEMVGIPKPAERLKAYPHEFSGGMRQRVVIATAFLNQPDIIIADEPTTALDVTIQAQILAEVQKMAAQNGTAVIWISHDMSLLSGLADRVMVMYAGQIVESGSTASIIEQPNHPYTRALMGAIPVPGRKKLEILRGFPPNLLGEFTGCAFAPRCPVARDHCEVERPELRGTELSHARCHYPLQEGARS